MKDSRRRSARRLGRLGMPIFLSLMALVAGCANDTGVPTLLVGSYAAADAFFMPLRSVVGTVLLGIINGTL